MPVQKASTVHTTITNAQIKVQPVTLTATALADNNQIEIECGNPAATNQNRQFTVLTMTLAMTGDNAADNFDYDALQVDDVAVTNTDVATFAVRQVAASTAATRHDVVPGDFSILSADGELDLVIVYANGGGAVENVSGFALVETETDTVCAFTTGADD